MREAVALLHVRAVSPAGRTGQVMDLLTSAEGVRNVVVLAGAAQRPGGDAVAFDVPDEHANPVFEALRELGLDHVAAIAVQRVDATLDDQPPAARGRGVLRHAVAPVWELVEAGIHAGGVYAPSFYVLLAIAGLIGAVGIFTNSQILIVAAMVVGPEYTAIIAVALGISQRAWQPVRDGLVALSIGFAGAIGVTLAFSLAIHAAGIAPAAFLAGQRPVADLINAPDLFSVIVAVLAAIVGVVSLAEARANALIGVFISITTIPAAASVGVSIAFAGWREARGSLLQLLLNVVLLVTVGAAGLSVLRGFWRWRSRRKAPQRN